MIHQRSLLILFLGVFLFLGCSQQDDPTQPNSLGNSLSSSLSAIIHGDISRDQVDFEFAAKLGEGIDPDQGSLLVRGSNLTFDAELGAWTVDLSVYNDSEDALPEPVGLTFIQFIPEDVTILNSDNEESGVGALLLFEFDDEDGEWSPGEESQSRTVQFAVAAETSFGFVARIDVALSPASGTIGGIVWMDENEDGIIDADEDGASGFTIALHTGDDVTVNPLTQVVTGEDGTYRFDGLDAGYYTVVRMPMEGYFGTTPAEIAVLLVEMDGTVSDFLLANFGVKMGEDPGDDFVKVGDYVHAKGWYSADDNQLVSEIFNVCHCDGNKDGRDDDDDDDDDDNCDEDCDDDCDDDCNDDGCRQNSCWGRLAGPVTGLGWDEGYLEIMGTPIYFHDKDRGDDCDWDLGVRVRVDAYRDADMNDGKVMACRRAKWWNGNRDRVRGFVQEVIHGDDGYITGVVILNTMVTVPLHEMNSEISVFTGSMRTQEIRSESR